MAEPVEVINVDSKTVGCDGGVGSLGHPRVYLNMGKNSHIECPYCGKSFVCNLEKASSH